MSIATNTNVHRHRCQCLSAGKLVSDGRKNRFTHKRRIFIGKRSISIRVLCRPFLFRKKGERVGVSQRAVLLPFCHETEPFGSLHVYAGRRPFYITVGVHRLNDSLHLYAGRRPGPSCSGQRRTVEATYTPRPLHLGKLHGFCIQGSQRSYHFASLRQELKELEPIRLCMTLLQKYRL